MAMAIGTGPIDAGLVVDGCIVEKVVPRMVMEIALHVAEDRIKSSATGKELVRKKEMGRRRPALTSPLGRACNPEAPQMREGARQAPDANGAREVVTKTEEEHGTETMG